MAYTVSEKFREKVYSGESLYSCKLTIDYVEVPYNQIESIKISSPIIDSSSNAFYLGSFVSQSITVKFKNLDGLVIQSGSKVDLSIGQYIDTDYEYVPIGKYLIDDLGENYQTTCEITCLDYAVKLKPNIDYSPCFTDGKATIDTILKYICESFGVTLGTYPSINGDIETSEYDSTVSGKQFISYIAELKGSNAKFGRDGKLYLIPLKSDPVCTINALSSKSWELNEKYEISRVVYEDAIRHYENGTEDANTLYIRTSNIYIGEVGVDMVKNIYDAVNGFKMYSLKCENMGDISLDAWDLIRYQLGTDSDGNPIYYDTLNNNTITYQMTIMSTVETKLPTTQQTETTNIVGGDTESKFYKVSTEVNKITGNITMLTAKTTEIEENITNNYYTVTQTNQLIQNAESGVTNTFSEAGGNNIFRNTGLWFKADTANIQNLYDESFVYCTYNSDAVNKSLTNVYPSSTSVTGYIRSENLMEINSAYEYSLDVPELTYKHGDTTLSYKTSLLELTSNREFQLENGEILKHELSAGSSTIKFKSDTAYVMLLIEVAKRNIIAQDDLNGNTIYSSLPDNFYENITKTNRIVDGEADTGTTKFVLQTYVDNNNYYVGFNSVYTEKTTPPSPYLYYKSDNGVVNNKSITLTNTSPLYVLDINKVNVAYPYLTIEENAELEIADAKTTLKSFSIQIKTSDTLYEFWEGEVVRNTNDEAANNNSMLLLNGELSQEQEVPDGNYSISFMYRKLNELANASVIINDKEYQLDSTSLKQFYTGEKDNETGEYIVDPIEVTANHIKIKFVCDTDKAVEVYDLMCNKGTVKLAYSQNANETTTETVNISKGITITSTNMETIFKANANGIRILTLQYETIAYFTDKGLSTKELIVEDEAQICGTLIQEVGDQSWFTRM